jgi:hypothetical protein
VTTAKRSEALPEIPTVDEFVPGYETSQWYGVGVPKNTPTEIVDKLNKEVNAALADPKMRAARDPPWRVVMPPRGREASAVASSRIRWQAAASATTSCCQGEGDGPD